MIILNTHKNKMSIHSFCSEKIIEAVSGKMCYSSKVLVFYLPRRRRPGTGGREILQRPPSVCPSVRLSVRPSVCPSVTFSFRTVTQKRIDVFSRNFEGTCTMSWGVCCIVFDIDGMLFEFFMNFLNIEKNKI